MTARFEINCDVATCIEFKSLIVDESVGLEIQALLGTMRDSGWTIAPGQRHSSARDVRLRILCPAHKGWRR